MTSGVVLLAAPPSACWGVSAKPCTFQHTDLTHAAGLDLRPPLSSEIRSACGQMWIEHSKFDRETAVDLAQGGQHHLQPAGLVGPSLSAPPPCNLLIRSSLATRVLAASCKYTCCLHARDGD